MVEVGFEHVHLLLLEDELLVDVGVLAEGDLLEEVERGQLLALVGILRRVEGDDEVRERGRVPVYVRRARLALLRLVGDVGLVVAALPVAPVLLRQRKRALARHVADDDERGVFGPVEAPEELQAVVVLVGHVLDVSEVAHRRVRVGVTAEGRLAQDLVHLGEGVRAVLVVLALDGLGLGLELFGRVLEADEAVGLDLHDLFEVVFRERGVVDRAVVGGIGVRLRARALENLLATFGREVLASAEHYVLEEVCVAAPARLDLVARACGDYDVERDEVRVVGRDCDEPKAVRQVVNRVLVGEELAGARLLREADERQREHERGKERAFHCVTPKAVVWDLVGRHRDYTRKRL